MMPSRSHLRRRLAIFLSLLLTAASTSLRRGVTAFPPLPS